MSYTFLGAGVLVAAAGLLFAYLFRRLIAPDRFLQPSLEWCSHFSIDRYRPMERLFSEKDYRFLADQPGYSPRLARRLRAERRHIFRQYLRSLGRDFNRLHTAARFLVLQAPEDRPDLVVALFRQRMGFRYAMAMVHCSLTLQALGIGTVDVRGLVRAIEQMGEQFRQASAVPATVTVAAA